MTSHAPARLLAAGLATALLLAGCGAKGSDGDKATKKTTTTTSTTVASSTTKADDETTTTEAEPGGTEADSGWGATAVAHRGEDGKTFTYTCPPDGSAGSLWGVETYTDDSSVCTAGVHVGLITLADGGKVTIEIAPGEQGYDEGTANGITSASYGPWSGSYTFPDAPPGSGTFEPGTSSWNVTAAGLSLEPGSSYTLTCSGSGKPGSVWGTDTYTADSSICTAAAHAGLITVADGGAVTIDVGEGAQSYEGTTAHGITSSSYGPYNPSYTFPEDQPKPKDS